MSRGAAASLEWSRAMNQLAEWKRKKQASLEEQRLRALAALPEAARLLDVWHAGLAAADKRRDDAVVAASRAQRDIP